MQNTHIANSFVATLDHEWGTAYVLH